MKILVGTVSCEKNVSLYKACLASWMKTSNPDIKTVVVIGSLKYKSPVLKNDILYVPGLDDAEHCPGKSYWLACWAHKNNFDFLFKCDDDSFVNLDKLYKLVKTEPPVYYRGYRIFERFASGGGGYLLSRKSIEVIANCPELIEITGLEDLWIGNKLEKADIKLNEDQRFWPWANKIPTYWNDTITTHRIPEHLMMPIHLNQSFRPRYFDIKNAQVAWGNLGLNGFRGFSLGNDIKVKVPSFYPVESLISAHAPSKVIVDIKMKSTLTGMLDADAKDKNSVELFLDDDRIGEVTTAGNRVEVEVEPGEHTLTSCMIKENTNRYLVWSIRPRLK